MRGSPADSTSPARLSLEIPCPAQACHDHHPRNHCSRVRHPRACPAIAQGARRRRLRDALTDPGGLHPRAAGRPRPARRGPDRHRQDRRLRPAAATEDRPQARRAAGPDPDADARAGDPGRRGLAEVRPPHARLPCAADLRWAKHGGAVARPLTRHPCHRRHSRPRHGPPGTQEPGAQQPAHAGAGRSRRNAAHGLHRRRQVDPRTHPGRAPDRAVLGHHA